MGVSRVRIKKMFPERISRKIFETSSNPANPANANPAQRVSKFYEIMIRKAVIN